jgi:hypothetical protein
MPCEPIAATVDNLAHYPQLEARCYWDFLRVLIPGESELLDAQTNPTPAAQMLAGPADDGGVVVDNGEQGTTALGTYLVVPTGHTRWSRFHYQLPHHVITKVSDGWRYQLVLQKQPGMPAVPVKIRMLLPPGAVVVDGPPDITVGDSGEIEFTTTLLQRHTLTLTFRR